MVFVLRAAPRSEKHVNQVILVVHLLVALAIIGLILLQRGKGADVGASFGGGASQTVFGSSGGGNALTSATGWLSAIFFATSFGLAMIADQQYAETDDLGFDVPLEAVEAAPLAPAGDLPLVDEANENSGTSDLPID
jgi:preprotein translocase subunit SecG